MPTAPSDLPRWATDATATKTEPSSGLKDTGQLPGFPIAAGHYNWLINLLYQWVLYFSGAAVIYTSLEDALADLDTDGDEGIVDETDNTQGAGVEIAMEQSGSTSLTGGIDASGSLVVFAISSVARAVDRDLTGAGISGTPIANYTKTNSGTIQQIRTDGTYTVLIYGNYVECYNATTGASLWDVDHGAPVWDVCLTAGFCFIVGDIGTSNYHLRKLAIATGTESWGYRHSAAGSLYSVETSGRQVFVAGTVSSYGSGATLRAIRASDGFDDGNEGGLGDETGLITWNVVLGTAPTVGRKLACDGGSLYVGHVTGGGADEIEVRGCGDGAIAASLALGGTLNTQYLAVDQDYLYASIQDGAGGGGLWCLDKATLAVRWKFRSATDTTDDHVAVTSDGFRVFALGSGDSGVIYSVSRGNRPTRVRFMDPTTAIWGPIRRLELQPSV